MREILQQAASSAAAIGPTILLQGMQIERPVDVVKATALQDQMTPALSAGLDEQPIFRKAPSWMGANPRMTSAGRATSTPKKDIRSYLVAAERTFGGKSTGEASLYFARGRL